MCLSARLILTLTTWKCALAVNSAENCDSNGISSADLSGVTNDACLDTTSNTLLHLRKLTSIHKEVSEEGPCVWGTPHNQGREEPLCEDGAFRWDCVGEGRGQRLQCPPSHPVMCSSTTCGDGGENYCCEVEDCTLLGGVRPADNCSPSEAPGCSPTVPLDLVFLLDSSGSMGQIGFDQSRHYLKKVIARLPLGPGNASTHVSIVQFSEVGEQSVEVPISDGFILEDIEAAVNTMQWHTGDTHTGEAIDYVLEHVFPQSRGGTAEMIALITDGKANGNVTPAEAAAKAKDLGVEIIAIGVSDYDHDELMSVTGEDSSKVLTVSSYDELVATVNQTVQMVCDNAVVLPTPAPTAAPPAPPPPAPLPANFTKHFLKSMLDDKCLAYINGDVWMKECEDKSCKTGQWCQYWAYSDDANLVKTSRAWAGTTAADRCIRAKDGDMVKKCSSATLKSWAYNISTQQLLSLDSDGNCLERGPHGDGVKSEPCNSGEIEQKWQFVAPV